MIDIATWNINGVRARIDALCEWLKEAKPDAVCLQEIKCETDVFPRGPIEDLGYNLAVHGQKGFNGVAILSKRPLEDVVTGLPGDESDAQARYIQALVPGASGFVRLGGLYLPNGNPIGTEKFTYKLAWMERLKAHAKNLLASEEPFILAGDYNVIPMPEDARHPENWTQDALFQPESRAAFRELIHLGLTDALRATTDAGDIYSFWDYTALSWQKNNGIRIDHLLLSPQAASKLKACRVDKHVRGSDKPSDHVPVVISLDI